MKTLKSLNELKPTVELLADEGGKRIVDHVINGLIQKPQQVLDEAMRYGRGAEFVKKTQHYAIAMTLVMQ